MSDDTKRMQEFRDAPLYEIENWSADRQREQTAATILAALIANYDGALSPRGAVMEDLAESAVRIADALRAAASVDTRLDEANARVKALEAAITQALVQLAYHDVTDANAVRAVEVLRAAMGIEVGP
jgi:hypothetical protein